MASALAKLRKRLGFSCPIEEKLGKTIASSLPGELCRHFSLDEIKTATDNFNEELIVGVGGFGPVYKGFIDEGNPRTMAIKRLNPSSKQGAPEFSTEILLLCQIRYVHLIQLIGYCYDEREMILVYDFMANGTLRCHLYDTQRDSLLWKQRLQICIGAARGLHYLHSGLKHLVIHRDVKTTNILLDNKLVAKVSDFRLSKLTVRLSLDNIADSMMVKGTFGYLEPKYIRRQKLTEKSDVYSFDVVLLEVLCARKALNPKLQEEQWHLANWARNCNKKGSIGEIIDPNLMGKIAPKCFKVYVEIAMACVQDQRIQWPKMVDVIDKLELALELQEKADGDAEDVRTMN
ncbi:receptor-like protein kinase FERONIA [Carya illinoinensis]|uniref:receptor-like protein kinase FERONIA n=1 Tax=Carya illinoinensis TaxID=32201 RepID=UPI001C7293A7|nr:receptor-like protein kinase FERONIA [Carya illinoinensis]